ncbi:MAG: hypothetical protein WEG36_12310 [Gemmatimonadota bacterium]
MTLAKESKQIFRACFRGFNLLLPALRILGRDAPAQKDKPDDGQYCAHRRLLPFQPQGT